MDDCIRFAIEYGSRAVPSKCDLAKAGVEQAMELLNDMADHLIPLDQAHAGGFYNTAEIVFKLIYAHTNDERALEVGYAFEEAKIMKGRNLLEELYKSNFIASKQQLESDYIK